MRTFEYRDHTSDRFWNIELQGKSYTVNFGRFGKKGQTQRKEFADAAASRKAHDKLIKQKLANGFVEITPRTERNSSLREALEATLLENPDDLAAHRAYADHLMELGDPRVEFIQVQLALEDAGRSEKERKPLQEREQELLALHGWEWLGGLTPHLVYGHRPPVRQYEEEMRYEHRFARGWLGSLHIGRLSVEFAAVLVQTPQTRLLRNLVVSEEYWDELIRTETRREYALPEDDRFPALAVLGRSPYLGNVRVFQLGHQVEEGASNCHTSGEGVVKVVRQMPRLEELFLFANGVDVEKVVGLETLTHLRILQIYHSWHYPLEVLASNPVFGQLTHLLLHPKALGHWSRDAPYIKLEGVRALLHSPYLKNLQHLRLRLTDIGDRGCSEIVQSGILRRLKTLDLRHGCITDAGAAILAGSPDLGNLELLDVSRNQLNAQGIRTLKAASKTVQIGSQQSQREAAESEYLYEGDIE